jgi:hypothetical protein
VEQAAEAALVRPQHHEVAEEVVPAVHDDRSPAGREQQESEIDLSKSSFFLSEESIEAVQQEHRTKWQAVLLGSGR